MKNTNPNGAKMFPDFAERLRERLRPRLKERPTGESDLISIQWTSNPFVLGYFAEAELHSKQCARLDEMVLAARNILSKDAQTRSRAVSQFARRLRRVCREYGLGDPLTYAQWAALARPAPPGVTPAEDKVIWELVAATLRVAAPHPTRGAE